MTLSLKNSKYTWARHGGIEEDEYLDIVKYELEIRFPVASYDENSKTYSFASVEIKLPDDIYIGPPETAYHVDWGDGTNDKLNFREFTKDWSHTYSRSDANNTDGIRYLIVIKGHKLTQRQNASGFTFISQVKKTHTKAGLRNPEYLLILRSVK